MLTYAEYEALYPGRMAEEGFCALLPAAEAYVDVLTAHRAQMATGYKLERVKQAICAVINEVAAQNAAKNAAGARLQSITNDGYTEYYGSVQGGTANSDGEAMRHAAMTWLSGTGLAGAL